jgi:hypothetical protein
LTIAQTKLTGSTELAPIYRLFPTPSANHPVPYTDTKSIRQQDYFGHRYASSPLARDDGSHTSDKRSVGLRPNVIPRKPIGSSSRRADDGSRDTIVHSSSVHTPLRSQKSNKKSSLKTGEIESKTAQELDSVLKASSFISTPLPFLGQRASFMGPLDLPERRVIATSYRSASTSRVQIRPQLGQNPENIKPGKRIRSLNELPPVYIKDPIAARDPLSSQIPRTKFPIWSPPTILETQADQQPSFTSTSITTITGPALPQPLPQLDGVLESMNAVQAKAPVLSYKMNRTTLRNHSPQQESPKELQSHESQRLQADIGTLSESQVTPTKQRIATLCQAASAEGVNIEMQSTPTSTSTSQRRRRKEKQTAREAARMAFHHLQNPMAPQRTHSPSNMSREALEATPAIIGSAGSSATPAREDRLVVKHPEPEAENMRATVADRRASNNTTRRTPVNRYPRPVADSRASNRTTHRAPVRNYSGVVNRHLSIRQAVVNIVFDAWRLVEPAVSLLSLFGSKRTPLEALLISG